MYSPKIGIHESDDEDLNDLKPIAPHVARK
jgi:hypothetical protein